jgi:hypothetical protein
VIRGITSSLIDKLFVARHAHTDGANIHPGVSADSLYEAVAQGLRVFRENDWIDEVGHGQTTISVSVSYPEVQHKVRISGF